MQCTQQPILRCEWWQRPLALPGRRGSQGSQAKAQAIVEFVAKPNTWTAARQEAEWRGQWQWGSKSSYQDSAAVDACSWKLSVELCFWVVFFSEQTNLWAPDFYLIDSSGELASSSFLGLKGELWIKSSQLASKTFSINSVWPRSRKREGRWLGWFT